MQRTKKFIICIITTAIFVNYSSHSLANIQVPSGFADIVEPIMPAVVNISTTEKVISDKENSDQERPAAKPTPPKNWPFEEFNELFENFGLLPGIDGDDRMLSPNRISLGSGFIIDKAGFIVTNYHVIEETGDITVKLSNDKQLKAKIIGVDPKTDLALLKIDYPSDLPFIKFGDSDKARVGDWVIAIGNSFGLGSTVTAGIVSARARDIDKEGIVDDFIQTDAAINRGNSGGPMLNINGEVIGVNTAILSRSGDNVGIGFAVPASTAKSVIEQLQKSGKIKRGWLGVSVQPITSDIVDSLGLKEAVGALVVDISKGSPAERAGVQTGDIILKLDDREISTTKKLQKIVAEAAIGKKLDMLISRKNKQQLIKVMTEELKDNQSVEAVSGIKSIEIMGSIVSTLDKKTRSHHHINESVTGVFVKQISPKSLWAKKGLRKFDVIVECNQTPVHSPQELKNIIELAKGEKKRLVLLLVIRNNKAIFIPLPIK